MKAWVFLALALCCAVVVFAEHSPSFALALREDPEYQSTPQPEQPTSTDTPQTQPVNDPEQYEPTAGPEEPLPTNNPEQPEPSAGPEQPLPTNNPEQPEPSAGPKRPTEQPTNSDSVVASSSQSESSSEILMCAMVILVCPDNSTATQNAQCEYICGAAPIGGLSWEAVMLVREEFVTAYGNKIADATVDTMYGKSVLLTPSESYSDYCIEATIYSLEYVSLFPAVYKGVRVFYTKQPDCSPIRCPDGSLVGCSDYDACDWEYNTEQGSSSVLIPISAILFVIILSSCCCYARKRKCQAKCASSSNFHPLPIHVQQEAFYPAEQYEQLQQQEQEFAPSQVAVPMVPPQMNPHMMFPPHMMMHPQMMYHPQMMHTQMNGMGMPPMPPPMMMPNGAHPVMMQAPNGMWFPVPPHPEDA